MHVRSDTQVLHSGRDFKLWEVTRVSGTALTEFREKDDFLDSEFLIIFLLDAGD